MSPTQTDCAPMTPTEEARIIAEADARIAENCTNCGWRVEPRTPQCSKRAEHAATCDYPLPSLTMIEFNVTDVRRHINLATLLPDSEFYNPHHAAMRCRTWKDQTNAG